MLPICTYRFPPDSSRRPRYLIDYPLTSATGSTWKSWGDRGGVPARDDDPLDDNRFFQYLVDDLKFLRQYWISLYCLSPHRPQPQSVFLCNRMYLQHPTYEREGFLCCVYYSLLENKNMIEIITFINNVT